MLKIILSITGYILACEMYSHLRRQKAYLAALQLSRARGKPLLNAGCGDNPSYLGDVNLDIRSNTILPFYCQASIYRIPYPDKYFGAAICFHVLEHLDNPTLALAELHRVADAVYIEVPLWYNPFTWLHPDHKWVFIESRAYRIRPLNDPLIPFLTQGG